MSASRKYRLRKILGNRSFLDYNQKKFWKKRESGRRESQDKNFKQLMEEFVSFLKENKCKKVLEIGTGTGINLGYAKARMPELDCLGIDINEKYIEKAKKEHPEIEFYQANITKELIFIENKSFDCILSAGVLMHIPPRKIKTLTKEMKRIANKAIFTYEQDLFKQYGQRHSNNFVFYYDYEKLFKELKPKKRKEYENKNYAQGFVKVEGGKANG